MDVEPALGRRFLGMVEVDSGTLLVGDPIYCLPYAKEAKPGIDYESIIGASDTLASHLGGSRSSCSWPSAEMGPSQSSGR